jgi:hypothetical protein
LSILTSSPQFIANRSSHLRPSTACPRFIRPVTMQAV